MNLPGPPPLSPFWTKVGDLNREINIATTGALGCPRGDIGSTLLCTRVIDGTATPSRTVRYEYCCRDFPSGTYSYGTVPISSLVWSLDACNDWLTD